MTYPEFLSPFLISPQIPLRWYGLMYVIGAVCSFFIVKHCEKKGFIKFNTRKIKDKKGREDEVGGAFDMVFYATLGVIIGARVGFFLLYSPASFLTPWTILGINFEDGFSLAGFSGMSFHGGFIGLCTSMFIFAKKYNYKFFDITDCVTIPISVCLFFGRIGNFMNAELYGRVTDSFLGMRFPLYDSVGGYESWINLYPAIRPYTELRHPSQLYEAILEGLVLCAISYLVLKNKKLRVGTTSVVWVILYGVFRTLIENVREVTEWGFEFITSGMIYSMAMILIGLGTLIFIYSKPAGSTRNS